MMLTPMLSGIVTPKAPASDKSRFFVFGRVFSGKVPTGLKVGIMGPNYVPGKKKDLWHLISPKRLAKSDPMVVRPSRILESISLLEQENSTLRSVCLKDLQEDFVGGAEIIKSDPVGSFHETVLDKSGRAKMWCVGPETMGTNVVVDRCKGVQCLSEIKDSVVAGFQWASKEGALPEENKRGICFEVCDVVLPAAAIHRGGGTLRAATSEQAFPQCVFDYWDMVSSDPLEAGTQAAQLVTDIRKRKGLKEQMTPLSEFENKL
ncbi:hypothetical protein POTOM_010621 [Populus tomentosa]|uniref:Translation elongation factor EFG/EF2 domain-containing protein n=1 Tax=Populus tomentosa TaxID=118781 RepID=A0A8X8AI58_POPTO|nr:hypothetical protein POTOM_010621 [Populus tomentosa]